MDKHSFYMDIIANGRYNKRGMVQAIKYAFEDQMLSILDVFTELFGIRIAFFSTLGQELTVGKHRGLCSYCQLLRDHLGYESTCARLDKKMQDRALQCGRLVRYECHGGMTEVVLPVYIDDSLAGFLMIGQFRTSLRPLKQNLAQKWRKLMGDDRLEQAFNQTPHYPKEYEENILKLFTILVDHILLRHMIRWHSNQSIQPLVTFIQRNLDKELSIQEGAKLAALSPSSLAHKFRQQMGKSFKQFQIETKLDQAERYFREKPKMPVKEVAFRLGYSDALYFSRLFKKHRGVSPSQARQKFRRSE